MNSTELTVTPVNYSYYQVGIQTRPKHRLTMRFRRPYPKCQEASFLSTSADNWKLSSTSFERSECLQTTANTPPRYQNNKADTPTAKPLNGQKLTKCDYEIQFSQDLSTFKLFKKSAYHQITEISKGDEQMRGTAKN